MATKPSVTGRAHARAGRGVRHPGHFAHRHRARLILEPLESRVVLSGTFTWTGLSDGISWDSGGNWAGGQVPTSGASVVFPPIDSETDPTTSLPYPAISTIILESADVSSLNIQDNYTFEGSAKDASDELTLDPNATITTGTGDSLTILSNLQLNEPGGFFEAGAGSVQVDVQGQPSPVLVPTTITAGDQVLDNAAGDAMTLYTLDSGATLEISSASQGTIGSLDGPGIVQMDGGGASLAVGTPLNEYDVFAGGFTGNGTNSGGGAITMDGAGTLTIGDINQGTAPQTSGAGSFQVAVDSGLLLVSNAAYLADGTDVPGLEVNSGGAFGGPGTVNDSGQALFKSGSKFAVVLGGLTAGESTQLVDTDSDSKSSGTAVQIGGSNLEVLGFQNGYEPVAGDTFTIISTSNGTISGQFANAAAGATITVDNVPFQVNYTPDGLGDGNSVAVTLTALGTMTTTQLASSSNPAYFGGPITFTATVAARTGAISVGTVTFEQGSTILAQNVALDAGGVANSPAITSLATGSQPITAVYSGEDSGGVDDVGSTSSIIQTINPLNTSTNLISSLNPSTNGQSVTFTATVQNAVAGSMSAPTGTVQFIINGVNYQSPVSLVPGTGNSSTASFSDAALAPGVPYVVTAVYSNTDGNYVGGTSNQVTQNVEFDNYATTTKVASTANPAHYGQSVSFIATVQNTSQGGGAPTGSVQFYIDGAKYLGPITLVKNAVASSTAVVPAPILAAGNPHTVYAVFTNQDGNFVGGTSNQISQNISTDATTTTLVSNTATSYAGQPVTFVATVQNNSPGGAAHRRGRFSFTSTAHRISDRSRSRRATVTPARRHFPIRACPSAAHTPCTRSTQMPTATSRPRYRRRTT